MENSAISWTDHTFNPWMGCTKVSEACKFCYAERDMDHRYGKVQWGPSGTRVLTSEANWRKPVSWNKKAAAEGRRMRVFCASLADVFEDWKGPIVNAKREQLIFCPACGFEPNYAYEPPLPKGCRDTPATLNHVRRRLFQLIDATPNLDWLLLTKRPENIAKMLPPIPNYFGTICPECRSSMDNHSIACETKGRYRRNLWLGCSVENQERADARIPELLKCRDLARVLFLSCEPLLGPVELGQSLGESRDWCDRCDRDVHSARVKHDWTHEGCGEPVREIGGIDWVITGGESGPTARPSHPDWFRSLRDQCAAAGVAFHHKQNGEYRPWIAEEDAYQPGGHWVSLDGRSFPKTNSESQPGYTLVRHVGKAKAGHLLDGREHLEFPAAMEAPKDAALHDLR